jgi:hypothetical protein
MVKRTWAVVNLIAFVLLLAACATTSSIGQREWRQEATPHKLEANKFLEIQLITTKGESYIGKLTELVDDSAILRPYPYWDIEPVTILIEDIFSIKLAKVESQAGKGFLSGFGMGFIVTGIIGIGTSRYNTQFQSALVASPMGGLLGGLIGLAIGGIGDLATKTKYEFNRLSTVEKKEALRKIMGL